MKTIKVNKEQLIDILEKNKEKHIKDFKATWAGYLEDVETWLESEILKVKADREFNLVFPGLRPESYEKDYTRILGMLNLSVDLDIELDEQEYISYIDDEWSWKDRFSCLNSTYSKV